MRKIILMFALAFLCIGTANAWIVNDKFGHVLDVKSNGAITVSEGTSYSSAQSTRVTRGFSFYVVGGGTVTAITYKRFVSSMAVTSTAGLYPGTTHFVYADGDKDTIAEFVTYLNAMPVTTVGCEGGIVATIDSECYENNLTAEITANALAVTVHTSTNPSNVSLDNILGIINKVSVPGTGYTYAVEAFNTNVTFGTGNTNMYIRKGANSTSSIVYQQKVTTSATDESMDVPVVYGDINTAIRFEVICSSWISAGQFNRSIIQK